MSAETTKNAILRRVARKPVFEVVPEHAIALFDHVIEQTETEAVLAHPDDQWARIDFWKTAILEKVASSQKGMIAGQFHEYFATLLRNEGDSSSTVPSYGGEARAQYDAYMACCASLD